MKPLADFLPRLLPYLAGCPAPMAVQALLDSAVAFCEGSMAIRHRIDTFTQPAKLGLIDLDLPAQQSVARVLALWADGVKLSPTAVDNAPAPSSQSGKPSTYYSQRSGSEFVLILQPTPSAACQVVVDVALRPLYSATQVENDLFELWLPAVVAGAMSRLMAISDQPFTNLSMAMAQSAQADRLTAKARVEGSYGRVRGGFSARMKPFA